MGDLIDLSFLDDKEMIKNLKDDFGTLQWIVKKRVLIIQKLDEPDISWINLHVEPYNEEQL